ncbi:DeoR/GlpR family DNA-binding transcription regulator [Achromobacter aloeverae]|uniref:Alkaline phosphatase n=1 Tax=Achromobacter aloeverae TaxID=1750518 RepID=A0A4Q1HGV2_9BURK|nr:DeoR/GlpR family DNA-binding transcription regulator [Achromobacter aloeverae]RXN86656.1 alkaline phosphatase [Achromobacter aloeverae]
MWQEDRYRRIRNIVATLHSVTTDRIVEELGVSRETVRRDLIELEAQGALRRTHGGVVSLDPASAAAGARGAAGRHERLIARAAAARVQPGQTVFIEAGEMALYVADALAAIEDLLIVTNAFVVALRLRAATREGGAQARRVLVLGGELAPHADATQGEHTVAQIHRFRADAALLCPVGLDARHGAAHDDLASAEVARAMAGNARQVLVMADDTRLGATARVSYWPAERITTVFTNRRTQGQEGYDALAAAVGEIVIA